MVAAESAPVLPSLPHHQPAATASPPPASPPNNQPISLSSPKIERVEFLYTQTPVEGCDLLPYVVIKTASGEARSAEAIEARTRGALSVQYRWNRCAATYTCARTTCFKPARHQFVPLLKIAATMPCDTPTASADVESVVSRSFYCSVSCMRMCWAELKTFMEGLASMYPRLDEGLPMDERVNIVRSNHVPSRNEGVFQNPLDNPVKVSEVAFIRNYAPTPDDIGHTLELVCRYAQRNPDGTVNIGPPYSIRSDAVRRIPDPPSERRMINLSTGEYFSPKPKRPGTFRVLTYNILSEIYSNSQVYPHCPSWALAWTYRKRNLIREIARFDADILCLQEIQADHYEDHFQPYFARLGYESYFKVKTREAMGKKGKIDGCATFFQKDMFALREKITVEYNSIAQTRTKESRTLNRCLKGNVGLILILDVIDGSGPVIVANTHLYWDPDFTDVKLFQVDAFMSELEVLIHQRGLGPDVPIIVGGDFNSEPISSVYEFLSTGHCSMSKNDVPEDSCNVLSHCRLQHNLNMRSAYSLTGSEPPFTNYTHNFVGVLDYIWYSVDGLVPTAVMEIPDVRMLFGKDAETSAEHGIPNAQWSSDHVALMTEFQIVKSHRLQHGLM